MKTKLRLVGIIVVALVLLIVIMQNTQSVDTRLLFVTLRMPRALLLITTLLVGFISGLVFSATLLKKPPKSDKADKSS
ncbi:LapA family protein [Planctomycetota bacterium]